MLSQPKVTPAPPFETILARAAMGERAEEDSRENSAMDRTTYGAGKDTAGSSRPSTQQVNNRGQCSATVPGRQMSRTRVRRAKTYVPTSEVRFDVKSCARVVDEAAIKASTSSERIMAS